MTETITHPTNAGDQAERSIVRHHEQLTGELNERVQALLTAARAGGDLEAARGELIGFLDSSLMPHASAEERTLYTAAHALPQGRLLVEAMTAEHRALADRVAALRHLRERIELAASAAEIRALFAVHLYKENELLLPLLVGAGADLPALLHDTHHLLDHEGSGEHRDH
ncbi:hemerythrin domain-containing protein [Actinocrinis puniceicyclus]|uniref:Hemerythrin domain-containing protein n=1 Tax=Actinocrinis puniceicyclus TaxID=977794 RepID=A0A8J7WUL5_9ACTN|nr:hemerythrin domain-containing protein [Actinocrinis puniceicyclus]MBS2966257.1 hemerythrin domain-containing protein [Actinocrinis puniceicyclus]